LKHIRREAEGESHGADGFDLKENDDTGALGSLAGGKHDLADGEVGVGVGEDGDVGMDLDPRGVLIDVNGDGIILHFGGDAEVAADFPGEDPGFEAAVLMAEESAVGADNGKRV
jgi:hypothetical protein